MPGVTKTPPEFWESVAAHVAAKVEPVLKRRQHARGPVISYLRDLEAVGRRECGSRAVIQVIASGRHVLRDRSDVGPSDGPFSHTSGLSMS